MQVHRGLILSLALFSHSLWAADVLFHWFEYEGKDELFAAPLAAGEYQNPILAGFYPDPSITLAEDTFYMVNSSFGYAPGVPLFKSTDLVNWQPLGHILTRSSQLNVQNLGVSRGIFAPTLRYHQGVFYMITTAVEAGGNFLVTATDPAGEWSDPVFLPEIDGIDPDIFFDDDGRVYIAHNGPPEGEPLYNGHRAIWLWQYDLKKQKIVADSGRVIVNGGTDLSTKPIWIEGPHLYKVDGWYYLMCAEGGTGDWHSEVIFRTRSLQDPFVPYQGNPILTQRKLPADRPNPVSAVGHADMVKTPAGEWWAVFLGTRNYEQRYFNTGRETFLLPVTWKEGWPTILAPQALLPYRLKAPSGLKNTVAAEPTTGNFIWRDNFDSPQLRPQWNLLRTSDIAPYRLISGGGITLTPRSVSLDQLEQPSFIGRRQQHMTFSAAARLQLPSEANLLAGITAFQGEQFHYFFAVQRTDKGVDLLLEKAHKSAPKVVAKSQLTLKPEAKAIILGIEGDKGKIHFYWQNSAGEKNYLTKDEDAKILSTAEAGGFVGTYLGLHVRSVTQPE